MAGWIAAGAAVVGDIMSSTGQQQTNRTNMALQKESENWQTQMSNTAVQRRVKDLQTAGLNPLLATGEAASVPSLGPTTVSNPNASFGNLGTQVQSAQMIQQQKNLLAAQTNKTISETPDSDPFAVVQGPDGLPEVTVHGGPNHILGNLSAQATAQTIQNNQATVNLINAQVNSVGKDIDNKQIQNEILQMDAKTQRALLKTAIDAQNALNKAAAAGAGNEATIKASKWGLIIEAINSVLGHGTGGGAIFKSATGH